MKEITVEDYRQRITRVMEHVVLNLDRDLSMDELADVACFSRYHFSRVFRGMVGESVWEWVRRQRMERAALLLRLSEQPVTRMAFELGFEAHEAFTRAFKARYGVAPRAYRDAHQTGVSFGTINWLDDFQGGGEMEVKIETLGQMELATVRNTGPYETCAAAWQTLCSAPGVMASMAMPPMFLGICWDDPDTTSADSIRYDACVAVQPGTELPEQVTRRVLEQGEYAVLRHKGDMSGLAAAYKWLFGAWFPGSGREPLQDYSLEIYRTDPEQTPPEESIVDICVPLR